MRPRTLTAKNGSKKEMQHRPSAPNLTSGSCSSQQSSLYLSVEFLSLILSQIVKQACTTKVGFVDITHSRRRPQRLSISELVAASHKVFLRYKLRPQETAIFQNLLFLVALEKPQDTWNERIQRIVKRCSNDLGRECNQKATISVINPSPRPLGARQDRFRDLLSNAKGPAEKPQTENHKSYPLRSDKVDQIRAPSLLRETSNLTIGMVRKQFTDSHKRRFYGLWLEAAKRWERCVFESKVIDRRQNMKSSENQVHHQCWKLGWMLQNWLDLCKQTQRLSSHFDSLRSLQRTRIQSKVLHTLSLYVMDQKDIEEKILWIGKAHANNFQRRVFLGWKAHSRANVEARDSKLSRYRHVHTRRSLHRLLWSWRAYVEDLQDTRAHLVGFDQKRQRQSLSLNFRAWKHSYMDRMRVSHARERECLRQCTSNCFQNWKQAHRMRIVVKRLLRLERSTKALQAWKSFQHQNHTYKTQCEKATALYHCNLLRRCISAMRWHQRDARRIHNELQDFCDRIRKVQEEEIVRVWRRTQKQRAVIRKVFSTSLKLFWMCWLHRLGVQRVIKVKRNAKNAQVCGNVLTAWNFWVISQQKCNRMRASKSSNALGTLLVAWRSLTAFNQRVRNHKRRREASRKELLWRSTWEAWKKSHRMRNSIATAHQKALRNRQNARVLAFWHSYCIKQRQKKKMCAFGKERCEKSLVRSSFSSWKRWRLRARAYAMVLARCEVLSRTNRMRRIVRQWRANAAKKRSKCAAILTSDRKGMETYLRRWRLMVQAVRESRARRARHLAQRTLKVWRSCLYQWKARVIASIRLDKVNRSWRISNRKKALFWSISLWTSCCKTELKYKSVNEQTKQLTKASGLWHWRQRAWYCSLRRRVLCRFQLNVWRIWRGCTLEHQRLKQSFFATATMNIALKAHSGLFRWRDSVRYSHSQAQKRKTLMMAKTHQKIYLWRKRHAIRKEEQLRGASASQFADWKRMIKMWCVWRRYFDREKRGKKLCQAARLGPFWLTLETWKHRWRERQRLGEWRQKAERISRRFFLLRWKRALSIEREEAESLLDRWKIIQIQRKRSVLVNKWREVVRAQRPCRAFIASTNRKRTRVLFHSWSIFDKFRKSERLRQERARNTIERRTVLWHWRRWRTSFLQHKSRRRVLLQLIQIASSQAVRWALFSWKRIAIHAANADAFNQKKLRRLCSNVFRAWNRSFLDRKEALRIEEQLKMIHEGFLLGCLREAIGKRVTKWRMINCFREKHANRICRIAFNDLKTNAFRQRRIRLESDHFLARWKRCAHVRLKQFIFMWKFRLERVTMDMWRSQLLHSKQNERIQSVLALRCHSVSLRESWQSWRLRVDVERFRRKSRIRNSRELEKNLFFRWKASTASDRRLKKACEKVAFFWRHQTHFQVLRGWREAAKSQRRHRDRLLAQKKRKCLYLWYARSKSQREERCKLQKVLAINTRHVYRRIWSFWLSRFYYSRLISIYREKYIAKSRNRLVKAFFFGWNAHTGTRRKYREFQALRRFRCKSAYFIDWWKWMLEKRKVSLLTQLFIGRSVHFRVSWSIQQWRNSAHRIERQRRAHRLIAFCYKRVRKKRSYDLWKHFVRLRHEIKVRNLRFRLEARNLCLKHWKHFRSQNATRKRLQADQGMRRKKRILRSVWSLWKDLYGRKTRTKAIDHFFQNKRFRRVFNDWNINIRRKKLGQSRVASFQSTITRRKTKLVWSRWKTHLSNRDQLRLSAWAVQRDVESLYRSGAWKSWKHAFWLVQQSTAGFKKRMLFIWRNDVIRKNKKTKLWSEYRNRHTCTRVKCQAFASWRILHRCYWAKRRMEANATIFRQWRLRSMAMTSWRKENFQRRRRRQRVNRLVLVRRYKIQYRAFSSLLMFSVATKWRRQRRQMAEKHYAKMFLKISWRLWYRGIIIKALEAQRKALAVSKRVFALRKGYFDVWKSQASKSREFELNILLFRRHIHANAMQDALRLWSDRVARRKKHCENQQNADFAWKTKLWRRWNDAKRQRKCFRAMLIFWKVWSCHQRHDTSVRSSLQTCHRRAILMAFLCKWRDTRARNLQAKVYRDHCIQRRYLADPFRRLYAYTKRFRRFDTILGMRSTSKTLDENALTRWRRHAITSYAKVDVTWALWRHLFLGKRYHRLCVFRQAFKAWNTRRLLGHSRSKNICMFMNKEMAERRKKVFTSWKQLHSFEIEWRRRRHRQTVLGQLVMKRIHFYHCSLLGSVVKRWISWKNEKKLLGSLLFSYSKAKRIFKAWHGWRRFTFEYARHRRRNLRIAACLCLYMSQRSAFRGFVKAYLSQKRMQRVARCISWRHSTHKTLLAVRKWCQWKRYTKSYRDVEVKNSLKYLARWKDWSFIHRKYRLQVHYAAKGYLLHLQRSMWRIWTLYRHDRCQQQVLERYRVDVYLDRWKERARRREANSNAEAVISSLQKHQRIDQCRLCLRLWLQRIRRSQVLAIVKRDLERGIVRRWASAYYCKLARRFHFMSRCRQAVKFLNRWHAYTEKKHFGTRNCLLLQSQTAKRYRKVVIGAWKQLTGEHKKHQNAFCCIQRLHLHILLRFWRHTSVQSRREWDVAMAYERHSTYRRVWSAWGCHMQYKRFSRGRVARGFLTVETLFNRYEGLNAWRRWQHFDRLIRFHTKNLQSRSHRRMKRIFSEWKSWSHCCRIATKRIGQCRQQQSKKVLTCTFCMWKEYTLAWKMTQGSR
uniref:Predicted protein putative n=1 Tax=Albugo laibachii Nc14 TaxID=890382 RepID=F0WI20_9STRA|nr:predicted protein putative [Albugo laibachii Nc14]|eukprot:CCA20897.1 predicted protein putative [Albugo laibachii Nc14]